MAAPKEYLRRSLFSHVSCENDYISVSSKNAVSTLEVLLERSIKRAEGNSVIIAGPNGGGKTMVVQRSLDTLKHDSKLKNNYVLINLNGIIHTDDRCALIEVARQLNAASQLEEMINMSFADALSHIVEMIRSGDKRNKSIIFVLEELDLFTSHKNQTLLYNLFDLSQSPVTPIVVIGLTRRLDVLELLEKRVKSRFSHRLIHLFPETSFDEYITLFRSLLSVPQHVPKYKSWNKHIQDLSQCNELLLVLKSIFSYSADVQSLKLFLGDVVSHLSDDTNSRLSLAMFHECVSHCSFHGDSKLSLIHSLSVLELAVLIASKNVSDLMDGEPMNFEMIFDEYSKFISQRSHTLESVSKQVLLKAFEKLVSIEFLSPVTCSNEVRNSMKEYLLVRLTLVNNQIVESVKSYKQCPTDLLYWVEKEPLS